MGETESKQKPTPLPSNPSTIQATICRDFDRSFILFGKGCSGKSTLGNLLLWREAFEVHYNPEAYGLTKQVQSGDAVINPRIAYAEGDWIREPVKIQMLDQPASNDSDFKQEIFWQFWKKCIVESKGEMCANFLIVINLKSGYLTHEEYLAFMNIALILSCNSYSFFPNAAIVFTHADKIDADLNEQNLEQELRRKMSDEDFANVKELIALVEGRYIFINGTNHTEENRHNILKKIFKLTRSNSNVYIYGNHGFRGKELKKLFGADPDSNSFRHNLHKYDVEYHFNPDFNLSRKYDKINLEQEIEKALNELIGISKGVSVIILLISLEEMFTEGGYSFTLNLPTAYYVRDEFRKDFWNYTCILFKIPKEKGYNLERNLARHGLLRSLSAKVKSRYKSVSDETSTEEFTNIILNLVRKVKQDTEGKTYSNSSELAVMKLIIDKCKAETETADGASDLDFLNRGIPIFQTKTGRNIYK